MASVTTEMNDGLAVAQARDIEASAATIEPSSPLENEETTSPDPETLSQLMETNLRPLVPVEHVVIMRLGAYEVERYEELEHDAYLVHHSDNEGLRQGPTIWETEESTITEQLTATYAAPFKIVTKKRGSAKDDGTRLFPGGRPILAVKYTIPTCGGKARPALLLRVVHEGRKDGNGNLRDEPSPTLKCRGADAVTLTPLNRQIFMQKHFNWACHQLSPFLSVTNAWETAVMRLASFHQHGYINPKILAIDSHHPSWDHDKSKLYDARHIIARLGLRWRRWHKNEFLVEHSIPEEAVIHTMTVGEVIRSFPGDFKTAIAKRRRMDAKNLERREYFEEEREREKKELEKRKALGIVEEKKEKRKRRKGKIRRLNAAVAAAAAAGESVAAAVGNGGGAEGNAADE